MCCKASDRITHVVRTGKDVPSLVSIPLLVAERGIDASTVDGIRAAMHGGLIGAVKAGVMILALYQSKV